MKGDDMTDIISTERLSLRPFQPRDAGRIAYLAGDYDVARMCARVPSPYPVLAAEGWLELQAAARRKGDEFAFAVTRPRDGLIGACGVTRLKGGSVFELGYWLGRPYWGEGYATEAARAVIEWAQARLGATGFLAGHFADNPASGAVLRKLGFRPTHATQMFGLARGTAAPCERYVWSEGAEADSLAALAHAH
jgi:[ribosomal protein S5]-alanine N-acetyltransferase